MRTFFVSLLAVFIISLPMAEHAEAKRLGGGFSLGKSFSSPKKSTAPTQQQKSTTDQTKQTATTSPTKRSGMGGLMGGLLAGGLFGALLFGGAFEGIQFMDLLLIAAVIFIIYKIMSMRKTQQSHSYAGHNGHQAQQYEIHPHNQARTAEPEPAPEFKPMPSFSSGWGETAEVQLPEWFNKEAFLEGAREHFMKLQEAWDACDWESIKGYTSDELFQLLQQERAKLPEQQSTEVVSVMAELINFIDNQDEVIVSINFYGWLKEDSDETTEFNETWHLSRDMKVENADWFIIGIQQD